MLEAEARTVLVVRPNVGVERTPPARRLGREAHDIPERLAAQAPCRWRSARTTG